MLGVPVRGIRPAHTSRRDGKTKKMKSMRRPLVAVVASVAATALTALVQWPAGAPAAPLPATAAVTATGATPHTTRTHGRIYDVANRPVRLVGFNWAGTPAGGRRDNLDTPGACGKTSRRPGDSLGRPSFNYDDMYQRIKGSGYNVIRLPVSWQNLEPM